jgi:hypothetical protein
VVLLGTNTVPAIFLSYRRSDSADVVGRIYDKLTERFPRTEVFKDVDSIPLAVPFYEHIAQTLQETQCVLVVVGPNWASTVNQDGKRRLEDPEDYVRLEVQTALQLGVPVIPILVSGATMPSAEELPKPLVQLRGRNGISVRSDPDFHRDMDRLLRRLSEFLGVNIASRELKETASFNWKRERPILRGAMLFVGGFIILMGITGLTVETEAGWIKATLMLIQGIGVFSLYFVIGGKRDPPDWILLREVCLLLGIVFYFPAIAFISDDLIISAILFLIALLLSSAYFVIGWLANRVRRA